MYATNLLRAAGPEQDNGGSEAVMRGERIAALARYTPLNAAVSIVTAFLTAAALFHGTGDRLIIGWAVAVIGIAVLQLNRWRRHRRRPPGLASEAGLRKATVWALIAGSFWGGSVYFLPAAPAPYKMMLVVVIAGMAAGASSTLAPIPSAAAAFILCATLPTILYFLSLGDFAHIALATMGLVHAAAMLSTSRMVHTTFLANLEAQRANLDLLTAFDDAKREWLDISDSADAFALFDENDRLLLWNEAYGQVLSLPEVRLRRGALRADLISRASPPVDVQNNDAAYGEWVLRQATGPYDGTPIVEQRANGRWLKSLARRTDCGHLVVVHVDITELKQKERQLVETHDKLEQQTVEIAHAYAQLEKQHRKVEETSQSLSVARDEALRANAAKSQFLANMSHELRTPLNAIIGFSEVLLNEIHGPIGDSRYRDYAGDIHSSGQHLLAVIQDILDLAKMEAGKLTLTKQPVMIDGMITYCMRLLDEPARRGGIALVKEGDWENWPPLYADGTRLKQILLNLLSNAIKFTPSEGRVCVTARQDDRGAFEIRVSDTGRGIDAEEIPRLLQPFERAGTALVSEHGGTGLGLPIAKALVDLHGGSLTIDSEPGRGTTVVVSLPAAMAMSEAAACVMEP